ncbi:MAG: class I SAM-dependent RNA methyltransferase [Sandaracinaceae bacterium]|jgi:23S rRNA (uracil1939-C5)-methyltransferase|nr:class I SAM-dependent RNA methyltransferase [Sandaracinaceae bacterium]MBK6811048.1 class I SAM-dependent RNA methyltransferase [Sandaracinaceae bacterium]MBK7156009.1 class I SAM-dependent RNA methyltransferase [Sandaracinaceae bacterium]MBK7777228.1 class I SAM-dependent RNA methyltransferase [Sandaracinaceae bacterium]MBK8409495.1 class I SAM-dependent RNA methyltransferase [Sandaracinaceae bacterium]
MRKGDTLTLDVTALDESGDGVAQLGGHAVHVVAAFPGERVSARVDYVSKRGPMSHAHLLEVLNPHPARKTAPCAQHPSRGGRCTGCTMMPLTVGAQRAALRQYLESELGLHVGDGATHGALEGEGSAGYRYSSKRVAFGGPGRVRLGSFIRGTHRVAYMDGCIVEHPSIGRAVAAVERAVQALNVGAYDERTDQGLLRYVWFKTDGERVLCTLIMSTEDLDTAMRIASALDPHDVAGVALSVQSGTGNAVRGTPALPVRGRAELTLRVAGVPIPVGPLGFLQPNPEVAGQCYRALVDGAQGKLAFDLYAGAGITTVLLREHFTQVVPVEAYPESAAMLGVSPSSVEQFLAGYQGDAPELVVANPPRKGLRTEVCAALRRVAPREIRIMSCGPKGLRRDLDQLCAEDGPGARYRLVELRGFDTLPHTPHIELVARLERVDPSVSA